MYCPFHVTAEWIGDQVVVNLQSDHRYIRPVHEHNDFKIFVLFVQVLTGNSICLVEYSSGEM